MEQLELTRQLLEYIVALPEDDRELIVLRYWEGLTAADCAERLGRPASTIRTRVQRVLARLRTRLDRHAGGRDAWLAAMLPLAELPPTGGGTATAQGTATATTATATAAAAATSVPMFTPASVSIGGVLAATVIWLGLATHQGCGLSGDVVTPDDAEVAERDADSEGPTAADESLARASSAEGTRRADAPHVNVNAPQTDEDHPCDRLDPEDSPTYAALVAIGRRPTDDEFKQSYLECITKHPRHDFTAPTGPKGGINPYLAVSRTVAQAWADMPVCHSGARTSTARVRIDVFIDRSGHISFDGVEFSHVDALSSDELDCARQTILATESLLRNADVDQVGFEPGTALAYSLLLGMKFDGDGFHIDGAGDVPRTKFHLRDRETFFSDVSACSAEPAPVILSFDPEDGSLIDVAPGAGADARVTECLGELLLERIEPVSKFFPAVPEQAKLSCRFAIDEEYVRISDKSTKRRRYHCEPMGPKSVLKFRVVESE